MNAKIAEKPAAASDASRRPQFPFFDLKGQYAQIREEVLAAVARVFESQHFIYGPEVAKLEEEIAAYVGTQFAIGCASGSDALLLALMALEIGPGDEVITPPFTFVATAGSVARLGARPVFVDIEPGSFNLDPEQIERAVGPRTRAILPVDLFGRIADMDPILEIANRHGLAVIEDAAQTIGAKYRGRNAGALGPMGCFSFYPTKNLGGAGDGGLITTNDPEVTRRLKLLHEHGSPRRYEYELLGMNSRLDALQAAVLRVKLRHLEQWTEARIRNAARYNALFAKSSCRDYVVLPEAPDGDRHVYNQYTIRVPRREALRQHLQRAGIMTEIYYPYPLHLQPAFSYLGHKAGDFPETERACAEVLALPIYPELTAEQHEAVVGAISDFYETA
ncbi:MAG TPA: DegT/DnrJ/EryC1/StrS family aminotransferase [Verrucomicrobiae bacterium]|jgi:dTDP-4-amino-4,6-dideoxygalactose transaminase|nr:DegT/DnrJ/EryC1/StrS family aminotransferase [Verrucomicrobiae bacterium]